MDFLRLPLLGRLWPSENDYQMSRRTAYTLMAWSPVLFTAVIGVHTRYWTPEWEFPSADEKKNAEVYAYAPIVKKAQIVLNKKKPSADEVREVVKQWVQAYQDGELQPLDPAFYEDRSDDGIKGEILFAQQSLASRLVQFARESKDASLESRTEDVLLALDLAESVKYSDFHTLYLSTKEEGRGVAVLAKLAPAMDSALRKRVADRVEALKIDKDAFSAMTKQSRRLYARYKTRRGLEPLSIEEVELANSFATRLTSNESDQKLKNIRKRLYANSSTLPQYVTELGIAWQGCVSHNQRVDQLLKQLQDR